MEAVWEKYFEWLQGESARMEDGQGTLRGELRAYLERSLQGKFAVTFGTVFALDGTVVEGSDLIIYDRLHTPSMGVGINALIPIETTGIVVQVLDVLTDRLLIEEAEHLRAVRRLPKLTSKGFTGGLELMTPHPYTMGLLVVASSELSLMEIRDQLAELQADWPSTERVSAVVVLGKGIVVYETGGTGEVRFFPVPGSRLNVLDSKENTLAFLLFYITSYLNSIEIIPPNLITLLSTFNNLNQNHETVEKSK